MTLVAFLRDTLKTIQIRLCRQLDGCMDSWSSAANMLTLFRNASDCKSALFMAIVFAVIPDITDFGYCFYRIFPVVTVTIAIIFCPHHDFGCCCYHNFDSALVPVTTIDPW